MTDTAQVIAPIVTAATPWLQWLVAALLGWAIPKAVAKDPQLGAQVKAAAGTVVKFAPEASTIAALAGQPALAGGIEAAGKVVAAMTTTTDPNQLAALTVAHAQTLAAAGEPVAAPK